LYHNVHVEEKLYYKLLLYYPKELVDTLTYLEQVDLYNLYIEEQDSHYKRLTDILFASERYNLLLNNVPTNKKGDIDHGKNNQRKKDLEHLMEYYLGVKKPKPKPISQAEGDAIFKRALELDKARRLTKK
jgi:hypothetical protein